jgi:hypothetical protein
MNSLKVFDYNNPSRRGFPGVPHRPSAATTVAIGKTARAEID